MPNISEKQDRDDAKEIRLFGEKSIREEAYRHKIIELEKEVMKLESVLKDQEQGQKQSARTKAKDEIEIPEYSEGLLYEGSGFLDEKLEKYQRILEARARHITERLSMQAHNLIDQDKIYSQITNTKRAITVLALLAVVVLAATIFNSAAFFRLNNVISRTGQISPAFLRDTQNIKTALQDKGFYNNQYTIISLNNYNKMYKGVAELHFKPHDNWAFKVVAADIIENFKRLSISRSIELSFIYEDAPYAKVNYSPVSDETKYDLRSD